MKVSIKQGTAMVSFWVMLLLGGCRGDDVQDTAPTETDDPSPSILVDPLFIDFGLTDADSKSVASFVVRNEGEGVLNASSAGTSEGGAFSVEELDVSLQPGEEASFQVTFVPTSPVEEGWALVVSDDPENPRIEVELAGAMTQPALSVYPTNYDFGDVLVGESLGVDLELVNEGTADLTIQDSTLSGDDAFAVDESGLPMIIAPGEASLLPVTFTPEEEGATTGEIEIVSDDPSGTAVVVVEGTGTEPEGSLETGSRITISVGDGSGVYYPCAVSLNADLACKSGYPQQIFEVEAGDVGFALHSTTESDSSAVDPGHERYNEEAVTSTSDLRGSRTCILTSGYAPDMVNCFTQDDIDSGYYGARPTEYEITTESLEVVDGASDGLTHACWSDLGHTYCNDDVTDTYTVYRIWIL